jgi:hypothetical protein
MALDIDLYIDQGSDFSVNLTVTAQDGSTQDLTGYTVVATMRRSYFNITSYDLGATISDEVNGVVTLTVPAAKTALFWPTRYVYEVAVTNTGTGLTSRVFEGIATITAGVVGSARPEMYESIVYAPGHVSISGAGSVSAGLAI